MSPEVRTLAEAVAFLLVTTAALLTHRNGKTYAALRADVTATRVLVGKLRVRLRKLARRVSAVEARNAKEDGTDEG